MANGVILQGSSLQTASFHLRTAADKYRENARVIREELARLEHDVASIAEGAPIGHLREVYGGLAATMERQASEALLFASEFERAGCVVIHPSDGDALDVEGEEEVPLG